MSIVEKKKISNIEKKFKLLSQRLHLQQRKHRHQKQRLNGNSRTILTFKKLSL